MNRKIILGLGIIGVLISGCTVHDIAQLNVRKNNTSTKSVYQSDKVYNNEHKVKRGVELECLSVDDSYYSQAYCTNKNNTIRFYTTYKKIVLKYKIAHQKRISTELLNNRILPNNKLAHLQMWVIKK